RDCAAAAMEEAVAWGAQLIVVKGDMTRHGEPVEFDEIGRLLAAQPVPVEIVLGNHDVMDVAVDPRAELARHGFTIPHQPWHRDVPGLRLVFAHTPIPDHVKHGVVPTEVRLAIGDLLSDGRPGPAF